MLKIWKNWAQPICMVAVLFIAAGCDGGQDNKKGANAQTNSEKSAGVSFKDCDQGDANDQNDPCIISTLEQLQDIDSGYYVLDADIDASVTQTWNDGQGFLPLGGFDGYKISFDGRGHTITDLYINRPSSSLVGLFSNVLDGSEIINLGLTNANVTGKASVGGLVGKANGAFSVRNVFFDGSVTGKDHSTGGLIGHMGEFSGNQELRSAAVIDSYSIGSVNGQRSVGGLVGRSMSTGLIQSSFSLSSVLGKRNVGGLVGHNEGVIESSYRIGHLERKQTTEDESTYLDAGGLVSLHDAKATIKNSYSVSSGPDLDDGSLTGKVMDGEVISSYFALDTEIPKSEWPVMVNRFGFEVDEFMHQAVFEGWDFDNVWTISEGTGYPDLRSNPRPTVTAK